MTAGRSLVIGLLAVSLATGCGGDDGDGGSSATEWADDVCSSVTTWTDSISSAVDSLRGDNLTEDGLRSAVDDVESATSDFVDDVKGLGAPDTEAGQQAKESLDRLADDVEENVAEIEEALDDASGGSGVLEALTVITGTLSTMGAQLSSTFAALEQLDPGGELEEAFREADSCDELESGAS
jgi:ABC-type transporter Mla subunit MlaD